MTDAPERERFSLKRWSDRKRAAVRESATPEAPAAGRAAASPLTTAPAAAAPDLMLSARQVGLPPVVALPHARPSSASGSWRRGEAPGPPSGCILRV